MRLSNLFDGIHNINYRYNKKGLLQEKDFSGSLKTSYSYNKAGQLIELINQSGERILDQYTYSYDPVGNKIGINKTRTGIQTDSGHFQYEYNPFNQITRVLRNGETLREYGYDAFGNRIYKREGEIETNYTYNENNQLVKETGEEEKDYQYDLRGNLLSVSVDGRLNRRYEFDAISHMNAVYDETSLLSTYQYNGLGHRTGKHVKNQNIPGGQTELEYVLDFTKRGNNLLEKLENGETEDYIWDKNIISSLGKYDKKQFLNDELGSTIRTYFSNGREAGMYGYDEFGEVTDKRERTAQPFGFTGYQWDEVSDTYFAQAREYSPSIGAFISEDVVNDVIGLPETLNHYVYCWGNPCKWIDINGQFTQRDANQLISDYFIDEYRSAFEAQKDDISNTIDHIGKSVNSGMAASEKAINDGVDAIKNGVSNVAIAVNEFWGNEIYGVNTELYSKDSFSVKAHTGGKIIILNEDINNNPTGWSLNLSQNIPYTNYSVGFTISGKNSNINTWKTKNYFKVKELDGKTSYSLGYGFNNEGYYINQSMGGGTDKLPMVLPNGVKIDSYTNVTWLISQDETIVPWETAKECVGKVILIALCIALAAETGGYSLVGLCGV